MDYFSDRILLSGANSDIGLSILKKLESASTKQVIITSRKNNITNIPSHWEYVPNIDLTKNTCLEEISQRIESYFDGPFSVIHSVGSFWKHKPVNKTNMDEAVDLIHSHYLTLFSLMKYVLPIAAMKGGGKIIAFSCNSVIYNYPEMAAFSSVKAAVEGLIKAISNEWAGKGISANAFALPTIKTDKVLKLKKVEDFKDYITPDELAEIVLSFIKLPHNYINGSIIKLFKYNSSFYYKSYFDRNPPFEKC